VDACPTKALRMPLLPSMMAAKPDDTGDDKKRERAA
jgi:hypothetical protein